MWKYHAIRADSILKILIHLGWKCLWLAFSGEHNKYHIQIWRLSLLCIHVQCAWNVVQFSQVIFIMHLNSQSSNAEFSLEEMILRNSKKLQMSPFPQFIVKVKFSCKYWSSQVKIQILKLFVHIKIISINRKRYNDFSIDYLFVTLNCHVTGRTRTS